MLETNWSKGKFAVRGKEIEKEIPNEDQECFLVDQQSIFIGTASSGSIKVLNRKSLEFEKVYSLFWS